MRKGHWLGLGILLGVIVLILAVASPAHSQKAPPPKEEGSLVQKLARSAKLSEEQAGRFLEALGPAIRAELAAGKTVNLPGLGTFRVVRIAEHKDMIVGGRQGGTPIVVPAVNNVEFLPAGELSSAANAPTAVPADVVPPFQYNPLPGQTPGQKSGRTRVPTIRVP
jgi:nucleoid DNA-binding protein